MVEPHENGSGQADDTRVFGWMLAVASVFALLFAMAHPQLHGRDIQGVVREMAAGARLNGWVHGILMALYVIVFAGLSGLSQRLGWRRPEVAVATIAYALGAFAMIAAAVINGFALAQFAGRYLELTPDQAAPVATAFNLASSISGVWAGVGAVATSAAVFAWSLGLVRLPGAAKRIGLLGLLIGLATTGLLVTGTLILDVHGFLAVVASQTIWSVAVSVMLIRRSI